MNDNPFDSPARNNYGSSSESNNPFKKNAGSEPPSGTPPTSPFPAQDGTSSVPASSSSLSSGSKAKWPYVLIAGIVVVGLVGFFIFNRINNAANAEKEEIAQEAADACDEAAVEQVEDYFGVNLTSSDLRFSTTEQGSIEIEGDGRANLDSSGEFSGRFSDSPAPVFYSCSFTYDGTGSGQSFAVTSTSVQSMDLGGAVFEDLTLIDDAIEAEEQRQREEAEEAERERQEEQERREREQERRERQAEQERQERQERREQQAEQERRQRQAEQEREQARVQQQQQQQPAQPQAPAAPQAPQMEWATIGPYGGFMGCSQAQSMWPSNSTECYQGGDGNYYFNGMRQSAR